MAEGYDSSGSARLTPRGDLEQSVLRTGALSMVGMAALGLTRVIHGALVSRAAGPEAYGRVGVLIAVTTIASLLLPAGVASAMAKFVPFLLGRGEPAGSAYRFLSWLGVAGAVVFGAAAAVVAAAAYDLDAGDTAQVAALAVAFSLYSVDKAALYGYGRIGPYVRLEVATSALAVVATVVVVATGSTAYLVPLALGYGAFSIIARILLHRVDHGQARHGGVRNVARLSMINEMVGYVALACVGTLASQGFLQGTQVLAARFATPAQVGYFAAAVTLVTPMYFLPRALGVALFPAMARAHGAGDAAAVRRHADLSTRGLLLVLAPAFAVGILLAREVLVLFGGAAFAGGAPVLRILLAATFLAVCAVAAVNTLSSGAGWQVRTPVASAVAGCLTGLAVVALLGGPLGAAGVGIGYLIGTAVTATGPVVTVWRAHRMAWRSAVVGSLATVGGALALAVALRALDAPVPLDVGAALLVGLASVGFLGGQLRAVVRDARVSS